MPTVLLQLAKAMDAREPPGKLDTRITGALVIDQALQEVSRACACPAVAAVWQPYWPLATGRATPPPARSHADPSSTPPSIAQVIDLLMRDYVMTWYQGMSEDPEFPVECRRVIQGLLVALSNRCKAHNWYEFLTSVAVDLFIKHIKLYRKAQKKLAEELKAENKSSLVRPALVRCRPRCGGSAQPHRLAAVLFPVPFFSSLPAPR